MRYAVASLSIAAPSDVEVPSWSQWRGPRFNGTAKSGKLPVEFAPDRNVVWSAPLPGQSAATPVVAGQRIFLSSLEDSSQKLFALCLDRKDGKLLWKQEVGSGVVPRDRGRENSLAECSPVTDGEVTVFTYGTGLMVAFDRDGKERWRRELQKEVGPFKILWGYASSPLLWEDVLYVQVLHRADSFVFAIDLVDGTDVWKIQRKNTANAESQESYTTPMPFMNGERMEILILGADCLTGHDPETGTEYWRWTGMNPRNRPNMRQVSSALVGSDGFVYVTSPQGNPLRAVQIKGDDAHEVWTFERPTPDVTVPVIWEDRLYALEERNGRIVCLDPKSGALHWQADLDTNAFLRASPTAADGKLYIVDSEGAVVVVQAGAEFKVLARAAFASYPTRSAIVVDQDQLLLRTADRLFCIGAEASLTR